jgi:hypothetical protein
VVVAALQKLSKPVNAKQEISQVGAMAAHGDRGPDRRLGSRSAAMG